MKSRKIEKTILIVLLAVCLSIVGISQKSDDPGVMLRAALEKEEVDGDLQGAIEIYQRIVKNFPSERKTAARALLRMGLCYEKLGNKEAQQAYQKLIMDFSDQPQLVTEARTRLALLDQSMKRAAPTGTTIREIWKTDSDSLSSVSPDGRYIAYVRRVDNEVGLYEIQTGKTRRLTFGESGFWVRFIVWSPDSKKLLYRDWRKNFDPTWRMVNINGKDDHEILSKNWDDHPYMEDWFPDGQHILATLRRDIKKPGREKPVNDDQIVTVSLKDKTVTVLKKMPGRQPRSLDCSPDGRFIVYSAVSPEIRSRSDIYLLSSDGSHEVPLINNPNANDWSPLWTPDGRGIVFMSDRSKKAGLWYLRVIDGKPAGIPELIKEDIFLGSKLGFSRSGAFFYESRSEFRDIYTAEIDFTSGKLLKKLEKLSQRYEGYYENPVWSPDGSKLLYEKAPMIIESLKGEKPPKMTFVIHDLKTGTEKEIQTDLNVPDNYRFLIYPRWSPDGQSILISGWLSPEKYGFYFIDSENGNSTPIIEKPTIGDLGACPNFFPDGKRMLWMENRSTAVIYDIATKDMKKISGRFFTKGALSPDGSLFASEGEVGSSLGQSLWIMPTEGGTPRELFKLPENDSFGDSTVPLWTRDGRSIIFYRTSLKSSSVDNTGLWKIPVSGGTPVKLELDGLNFKDLQVWDLDIHPDGKRIAFTMVKGNHQVCVMENFLPKTNEKK